MKRYKSYSELVSESKKIDCYAKVQRDIKYLDSPGFINGYEPLPPIIDKDERINYLYWAKTSVTIDLDDLEIQEANKTIRWFKK